MAMFAVTTICRSQNQVLQIFENKQYKPIEWVDITNLQVSENSGDDLNNMSMSIETQSGDSYSVQFNDSIMFKTGVSVPYLEINTDEPLFELPNREDFKSATITLHGFGQYDDKFSSVDIRGRGNTSWLNYPKKPYRLKFSSKISLCGLTKAKNYVLLANYTDPSFMDFVLATKLAQYLELPYTNDVIPVDVALNGRYLGAYILTNKPGINAGSVNIDEDNSIMWELDLHFDEDYKFRSPIYNLPVMVADPDVTDEQFEYWKQDFIEMEKAVKNKNAADYIDLDVYARYLLVYDIYKNDELQHPKSVKLYKTKGDGAKYIFGPIWDFDGAMSYWIDDVLYSTDHINDRVTRHTFFKDLEQNPEVRRAYRKYWSKIREQLPEILSFIDEYSSYIHNSALRDVDTWENTDDWYIADYDEVIRKLKHWIECRFEAIDHFDIITEGDKE